MRQILPGQEGRIQVKVRTSGYGGRRIRESVRIQTNDSDRPWLQVAVTGMVEKFVDIRPERVSLAGPADQSLFAEVEIIPKKQYPFTITRIKAKSGEFIKYELTKRCTEGNDRCLLRVENAREEKGRYVDTLIIGTDSPLQPAFPSYVTGMLR